jgi:hypothetical protein
MNKKEKEKESLKMRYAYMLGYRHGYDAAMPIGDFVKSLMELIGPRMTKHIDAWAKKEFAKKKDAEKAGKEKK